jgi:hypothetical protein
MTGLGSASGHGTIAGGLSFAPNLDAAIGAYRGTLGLELVEEARVSGRLVRA